MPEHKVADGDCITSIAYTYGFLWETIWNHPNNARVKDQRKDPNVLMPGDIVFVPDLRERTESGSTNARHRFRRKGVPARLRLRLMRTPETPPRQQTGQGMSYPPPKDGTEDLSQERVETAEDEPRANVPYVLEIDGQLTNGNTDSDGKIEVAIPLLAQNGRLIVEPGTPREVIIPLQLGHLNPIETVSGVKQRLSNLGLDCGDRTEEETEEFAAVVRMFQGKQGLEETGEVNDETRQKLQQVHGD